MNRRRTPLDLLVIALRGKTVAILGPRASGKTTLYNFLEHGTVDLGRPGRATTGPEKHRAFRNRELGLSIRKGVDVPGGMREPWEEPYKRADMAFYMFDVNRLQAEEAYAKEVQDDGRLLADWGTRKKQITVIGTHTDRDERSRQYKSFSAYTDYLSDLDPVALLCGRLTRGEGAKKVVKVFGSLRTDEEAARLVKTALNFW